MPLCSLGPELLGIFARGSSTEKLIDQITCGDVGYEKAIVLGKKLFPLIIKRLDEFTTTSRFNASRYDFWNVKRSIHSFLSRRCSREFLELYVGKHPELLDQVAEPGLYLHAVSELDVALKLHDFGLLPEEKRIKLVAKVTEYAVQGEDLYALESPRLRGILTKAEYKLLRRRVLTELVPKIEEVCRARRSWYSDGTREERMEPLLDLLRTLKFEYDDPEVHAVVDRETQRIEEWIAEQEADETTPHPRQSLGHVNMLNELNSSRSIFDDIDA